MQKIYCRSSNPLHSRNSGYRYSTINKAGSVFIDIIAANDTLYGIATSSANCLRMVSIYAIATSLSPLALALKKKITTFKNGVLLSTCTFRCFTHSNFSFEFLFIRKLKFKSLRDFLLTSIEQFVFLQFNVNLLFIIHYLLILIIFLVEQKMAEISFHGKIYVILYRLQKSSSKI